MGRHYDGDISGKFWFAVQDSSDPLYFGAMDITEENSDSDYHEGYIDYVIRFSDIDQVKEGIELCKKQMRNNYEILSEFFEEKGQNGYSESMVIEYYRFKHGLVINEAFCISQLQIYARLRLGMQILVYFNENPDKDCNFTAET